MPFLDIPLFFEIFSPFVLVYQMPGNLLGHWQRSNVTYSYASFLVTSTSTFDNLTDEWTADISNDTSYWLRQDPFLANMTLLGLNMSMDVPLPAAMLEQPLDETKLQESTDQPIEQTAVGEENDNLGGVINEQQPLVQEVIPSDTNLLSNVQQANIDAEIPNSIREQYIEQEQILNEQIQNVDTVIPSHGQQPTELAGSQNIVFPEAENMVVPNNVLQSNNDAGEAIDVQQPIQAAEPQPIASVENVGVIQDVNLHIPVGGQQSYLNNNVNPVNYGVPNDAKQLGIADVTMNYGSNLVNDVQQVPSNTLHTGDGAAVVGQIETQAGAFLLESNAVGDIVPQAPESYIVVDAYNQANAVVAVDPNVNQQHRIVVSNAGPEMQQFGLHVSNTDGTAGNVLLAETNELHTKDEYLLRKARAYKKRQLNNVDSLGDNDVVEQEKTTEKHATLSVDNLGVYDVVEQDQMAENPAKRSKKPKHAAAYVKALGEFDAGFKGTTERPTNTEQVTAISDALPSVPPGLSIIEKLTKKQLAQVCETYV